MLKDYVKGKIGLKRIAKFTNLEPSELSEIIRRIDIESPITPEIAGCTV